MRKTMTDLVFALSLVNTLIKTPVLGTSKNLNNSSNLLCQKKISRDEHKQCRPEYFNIICWS
jgi:hypothetical protein